MGNPEHLAKLKEGVDAWNQWRKENPAIRVDLRNMYLKEADLREANLSGADLKGADLSRAKLSAAKLIQADLTEAIVYRARLDEADLSRANLSRANLVRADLHSADLSDADLSWASLIWADLSKAHIIRANLRGADLSRAYLTRADLNSADLREAKLIRADLSEARLIRADLRKAELSDAYLRSVDLTGVNLTEGYLDGAVLIGTILEEANLTGCNVYGVSVWDIRLAGAIQSNLVITPEDQSAIQMDNLEVAQFVYLLLNNERIRNVIDTITSKVVLILGRFTPERKAVLDAIRDELRTHDYLPILFDFEKPDSKDLTGTVTTLANMARFVIADLTDPSSVPHELATIAPGTVVPVQTILLDGQREYAMFVDLKHRYHWVLEPYRYQSQQMLMEHLDDGVISPAEAKAKELRRPLP
jgi:uncharacterized protein YjbI with pentapeptide repeats